MRKFAAIVSILTLSFVAAACGGAQDGEVYPDDGWSPSDRILRPNPEDDNAGVFSPNLRIFGMGADRRSQYGDYGGRPPGIAVNTFLWRASLDTLSFMPLTTLDSQGGVIITDWRANPQVPTERFKVTVYILDKDLRADGVRVSVFRQELGDLGWADANVSENTATMLENQILRRARELKVDQAGE
jgi:hypothetical protein